jgi:transcriptional regulator GlxA family with amidase domain
VRYLEISLAEDRVHRLRSSELTEKTGYHPVHLGRLFKQQKGVTPREYQRRLKINRAKDLLRHTNLSLTAIAAQCGFSSLALFSRTFRQMEGMSPTEYITGKH